VANGDVVEISAYGLAYQRNLVGAVDIAGQFHECLLFCLAGKVELGRVAAKIE
jgi:hypothetical protein